MPHKGVSLNRALSKLGLMSRAEATRAIEAARVQVDGRRVGDIALRVVPERARMLVDGRGASRAAWPTILSHKPRGIVTSRHDPEGRPTIYDALGDAGRGLMPVGRLDLASSGLLILTSDTQLANWIADPASGVVRRYLVVVRGRVEEGDVVR